MQREELNFILQNVEEKELEALHNSIVATSQYQVLLAPAQQTLLQPIYDPISTGSFYGGEILVTTAIVSVNEAKGWAMVMDDNAQMALFVAGIDAAYGAGIFIDDITLLCDKAKIALHNKQIKINKKVNATRVSFDLM